MTSSENNQKPKRVSSRSAPDTVYASLPLPAVGEVIECQIPRYGLTVLVQRHEIETEEQRRARYTVVAPSRANDRNLHAARLGTGEQKAKKFAATICTEQDAATDKNRSGSRLDVPLDVVSCVRCRTVLASEGVELKGQQT